MSSFRFGRVTAENELVCMPAPIVLRQDVGHWTRFYIAESDSSPISWKQFSKQAKEHGLSRISRIAVASLVRERSLFLRVFGSKALPNHRLAKDAADRASHSRCTLRNEFLVSYQEFCEYNLIR